VACATGNGFEAYCHVDGVDVVEVLPDVDAGGFTKFETYCPVVVLGVRHSEAKCANKS
jgi:hypothetical protein